MQKMNNKKGVKLLAAIAIFAMAFAGFAVIIGNAGNNGIKAHQLSCLHDIHLLYYLLNF